MSVSGKTTPDEYPYFLDSDKPPNMATVTKAMADRLQAVVVRPSTGAPAGTEALRALGASGSTAAAGNDSRLSDERTPKEGSVTRSKMAGSLIQTKREAVPPSIEAGTFTAEVSWPSAFADTNYTVNLAILRTEGSGVVSNVFLTAKEKGKIVVTFTLSKAATGIQIEATAIHD